MPGRAEFGKSPDRLPPLLEGLLLWAAVAGFAALVAAIFFLPGLSVLFGFSGWLMAVFGVITIVTKEFIDHDPQDYIHPDLTIKGDAAVVIGIVAIVFSIFFFVLAVAVARHWD